LKLAVSSFRTRIALLFILLIAIVQGAAFFAVLVTVRHNVMARANEKLDSGSRVLQQVLEARGSELLQRVKALSSDFAFKQAAATGDAATIRSALTNHAARAGADTAMLLSLNGHIVAGTRGPGSVRFRFKGLLEHAKKRGEAAGLVNVGGRPFQLVVVPIYSPLRVAWVAMGFRIDRGFARRLQGLTHLNVSFITPDSGDGGKHPVSTLPPAALSALEGSTASDAVKAIGRVRTLKLGHEDWLTLTVPLRESANMGALLQESASAALAPYTQVRVRLIAVSVATLVLFIFGTIVLSRGVARPVNQLVRAAERLAHGDYSESAPVRGTDELGRLAAAFNDMQIAIREREAHIAHQAWHDGLTDLPSRNLAARRLGEVIQEGRPAAIVVLDVDRFKEINDTLGHEIGDAALQAVARRLFCNVRDGDTVARLGGDEFMVLLKGADEATGMRIARELARHVQQPARLDGITLYIELSMGIALYPEHGETVETLLRRADIAMYDAKSARTGMMAYQSGRDERHLKQLALMSDFRRAVDDGELRVYYQPKAHIADGEVTHVEALVRWLHPQRGLVLPDEFVPLAEQSGNIRWLTEWMLDSVIVQLRQWHDAGIELAVAMNLSAFDLIDPALAQRVRDMLRVNRVAPEKLMLEVTETAAMRDAPVAIAQLRELRRMGVRIAIDDFGTGYSSLSQLRRLPVDELKIDKSFVLDLRPDSEDAAIVRSAIELGHNMGLSVIAEGVETAESWAVLESYRCDMAQGYLISRPLPVGEFMRWLHAYRRGAKPASA
jgi:diguanylate cyclase (GGDEF)-like protein